MKAKENKPYSHPRWNDIPAVEVISEKPRKLTEEEKKTLAKMERIANKEIKKLKEIRSNNTTL